LRGGGVHSSLIVARWYSEVYSSSFFSHVLGVFSIPLLT
jgi:hypothetical protein